MRKLSVTISIFAIALGIAVICSARAKVTKSAMLTANVEKATVKISNFQFSPKMLTIAPGTTVEWVNEAGRHTVEADDGSFKSDVLKQGDKFEHTFDKAGSFAYHCEFHGEKGGKDMAGKIIVRGHSGK
jgi:plastocyanin